MMNEMKLIESLIRCAPLREELKPVSIFTSDPPEPIKADWIGISHSVSKLSGHSDEIESYLLNFYSEQGELLEALQFETLDIALDQAQAIVGIVRTEWHHCRVPVPEDRWLSCMRSLESSEVFC